MFIKCGQVKFIESEMTDLCIAPKLRGLGTCLPRLIFFFFISHIMSQLLVAPATTSKAKNLCYNIMRCILDVANYERNHSYRLFFGVYR